MKVIMMTQQNATHSRRAVSRMTINSMIHRKITHRRTDSRMADSKKGTYHSCSFEFGKVTLGSGI